MTFATKVLISTNSPEPRLIARFLISPRSFSASSTALKNNETFEDLVFKISNKSFLEFSMCLPSSYVCPHCGTKTVSEIHPVIEGEFGPFDVKSYVEFRPAYDLKPVKLEDVASCYKEDFICVTKCLGCARPVLWIENEIVWPTPKGILPVEEMPQDAKEIFKEAQSIINLSPRAACALLRISLELLVNYAGRLESPEGSSY